jgi:uncharacterized RDD family membrane protein YckC
VSQLVTGEAVALDLRPARLVSRSLACLLDLLIEGVVLLLFVQVVIATAFGDLEFAGALVLLSIVFFVVGYPVLFETLWRGRTPGKAALGIRVVRDDGGPIRFRHALTRALFNIVERPGITMGSAAVIASLLSIKGKRIGDMVAGTFVLQERLPKQRTVPIYMPPALAGWAATLDLSRLPDDLALTVRNFLSRAGQLRPDARDRLGNQLASAVAACTSPPPPRGTPGWAYLAAVIAERRRREEQRTASLATGRASPWQGPPVPPGTPAWGATPPPPWSESAPPVGSPPPLGTPPPVGASPPLGAPPRVPAAPSPQWGPAPVPPSPPPERPGVPAPAAPRPAGAAPPTTAEADEPPEAPSAKPRKRGGGFATPT